MQKVATTLRWLAYLIVWVYVFRGTCALRAQVAPAASVGSKPTASAKPRDDADISSRNTSKQNKLRKKYDVTKVGDRSIGTGLNFYSLEREARLGKDIADEIDASVKLNTDPFVNEYVSKIALKLGTYSDSKVPLTVKVLHDAQANAFAVPGGYLYVTTGLIVFCDDEAELAGAMAHEIAHVAARHGTKTLTKRELWGLASIPLSMVGGPAGAAVSSFASVVGPLTFLKLGRNEELEADLLGIEYVYLAGYDPQEFIKFFEKTKTASGVRANFFGKAFATHPLAEDRIRRAQSAVQILLPPLDEYILDTSGFQEVKDVLTSESSSKPTVEKLILRGSSETDADVTPDEQEPQD